ncbi:MAG: DNA mismatch repair protein MutL, partial [Lachnospiraceae bacterium]|nr:DNA mismatch repair protein MutL [Lachnospiraceae bacterium]
IVRSLFYNTPARRKFLKTPTSEAALVEDMLQKLALSRPDISVQLIVNSKTRISTPGNGSLKDVIFHIFGRETYSILLPVDYSEAGITITGFTARPEFSYQARNGEIYFVNNRYSSSKLINTAIEEVYRNYLMKHRFPFCVLHINIDPSKIDVNVHPQKLEVKFDDSKLVSDVCIRALEDAFLDKELIPTVSADSDELADPELPVVQVEETTAPASVVAPETSEPVRETVTRETLLPREEDILFNPVAEDDFFTDNRKDDKPVTTVLKPENTVKAPEPFETSRREEFKYEKAPEYVQESFFDKKLINKEDEHEYRIIGQCFDTYWLMQLDDSLYIVDQHAAHEKVNYENFLKSYNSEGGNYGQMINPPEILHLSPVESETLTKYLSVFEKIGYEIEEFGINSFAVRSVPMNLFGIDEEELFHRLLDELIQKDGYFPPTFILEKLASLSCKAAIKGGQHITALEMQNLMKQMFALENPYNCPHGRPTFIRITETELEKKFKRIV